MHCAFNLLVFPNSMFTPLLLDVRHSLCNQCINSVLPDDLQCCMCLSWVHKNCLIINNDNVEQLV